MNAKRAVLIVEALLAPLILFALTAWLDAVRQDPGKHLQITHAEHAPRVATSPGNGRQTSQSAASDAPQVTSTPVLYDFVGEMGWQGSYPCPYPVLRLSTYAIQSSQCLGHVSFVMRLANSNGDWRDFPTGTMHGGTTVNCQVGQCIPFEWLQSMPFTLTVDYYNSVPESNENNNTSTFSSPPPSPTACSTVVATPTQIPPPPATPTCTPTRVATPLRNLTGSMAWSSETCPVPVLKLRTTLTVGNFRCESVGASHMRLRNSRGGQMDFAVSGMWGETAFDELDCPVGSCMPSSWLTSFPLTLTVDVLNEVPENWNGGEADNDSGLSVQPPCGGVTPTPTPSVSPTQSATATPCPMNFSDVRPSDYFYEDVRYLYCHGAISGYADGTFRPGNSVTAGQSVKILVLAFNVPIYIPPNFCNIPPTDPFYAYIASWYYYYYGGPPFECDINLYRFMTRGQLAKLLVTTACWPIDLTGAPHFSDVTPADYFYQHVETAYNRGVISGYADHTFRPNNTITRGQVSKMVHRGAIQSSCPPFPTPIPTVEP